MTNPKTIVKGPYPLALEFLRNYNINCDDNYYIKLTLELMAVAKENYNKSQIEIEKAFEEYLLANYRLKKAKVNNIYKN